MNDEETFKSLVGQTLTAVDVSADKETVIFTADDGKTYKMYHCQDCCESVALEDIDGPLETLIGSPILQAEVSESSDCGSKDGQCEDSYTWTFYKLATAKGHVTLRWYGSSNGYYSESVDFVQQP